MWLVCLLVSVCDVYEKRGTNGWILTSGIFWLRSEFVCGFCMFICSCVWGPMAGFRPGIF